MHEYDTVLKSLLQSPQNNAIETVMGRPIQRWLNVEFPEVQQTRVDMLGVTREEPLELAALELQSRNDMKLPLRMAEYALRTYRLYEVFPEQHVLYVGNEPLRMPSELVGRNFLCRYTIIDIRTLDEELLLASPFASDAILAILAKHRDGRQTVRRILQRIATLEGGRRDDAFKKLMILAGLRKLGYTIRREVRHMPILDDIMDHDVLGPAIRQGIEQGVQQGLEQGVQQGMQQGLEQGLTQGRHEGELNVVRRLLTKRFGAVPGWLDERLSKMSTTELEDLSERLFDVETLDQLFRR